MSDSIVRRRWLVPVIVSALSILGVSAIVAWRVLPRAEKKADHWDEVAKAQALLDRGRPDLAFQAVSGIRDDAPGAAEGLTIAARALLLRGNISPARRILERSLKMKFDQTDASKMLAAIYLSAGDGQRGLAMLKHAAQLDPRDFRPWYAMGKVYHDLGDIPKSADAYGQALRRSPPPAETRQARVGRIRALLETNRNEEAAADLLEARNLAPDDPEVLGLASKQARDQGRTEEASDLAERALAGDPNNLDARLVRAWLRNHKGQAKEALEDLEQAARINPNHLGVLNLMLQVQTRLGMTKEAADTRERFRRSQERVVLMDQLTKEIDRHPDDPEPRWRMGQAAVEGGIFTLAYQCFQAALDLDPNYQPARKALQDLQSSGKMPEAMGQRPASVPMPTSARDRSSPP